MSGSQLENEKGRKAAKANERKIDNLARLKKCEVGDDGTPYVHIEVDLEDEGQEEGICSRLT